MMSIDEKRKKQIAKDILGKIERKVWKCLVDGCEASSINSHLIQKNRFVSQIQENSKIYSFEYDPFSKDDLKFAFKLKGWNERFVFQGFCEKHDPELFRKIEIGEIDFWGYESHLLCALRSAYDEYFKKKKYALLYQMMSLEEEFAPAKEYLLDQQLQLEMGATDQRPLIEYLEGDLRDSNKRNFVSLPIQIPRIEICASGVYTLETTFEIEYCRVKPTLVAFNLLPFEDFSLLIFVYPKDCSNVCREYFEEVRKLNGFALAQLVSNILVFQVENWICSPRFYRDNIQPQERFLIQIIQYGIRDCHERKPLQFDPLAPNLFIKPPN